MAPDRVANQSANGLTDLAIKPGIKIKERIVRAA